MGKIVDFICKLLMGIVLILPFLVFLFLLIALLSAIIGDLVGYNPDWHRIEKGIYYDEEHSAVLYKNSSDIIPPTVESILMDRDYFIIKQRLDHHSFNAVYPEIDYANTPLGSRDTVYYWLINKSGKELMGPFLVEDYLDTCELLGVSFGEADTLVLDKKWMQ